MYHSFIKLNKNEGITINDEGDISTINKKNEEYSLEEIIKIENELDVKKEFREEITSCISENLKEIVSNIITDVLLVIFALVSYKAYKEIFLYKQILPLVGLVIVLAKAATCKNKRLLFGAIKDIKGNANSLDYLEEEIQELEKELIKIQDKTKYEKNTFDKNNINPNSFVKSNFEITTFDYNEECEKIGAEIINKTKVRKREK